MNLQEFITKLQQLSTYGHPFPPHPQPLSHHQHRVSSKQILNIISFYVYLFILFDIFKNNVDDQLVKN